MNIVFFRRRPISHFARQGFRTRAGIITYLLLASERVKRIIYIWWNQEPFSGIREEKAAISDFEKLEFFESKRLPIPFMRRLGIDPEWMTRARMKKVIERIQKRPIEGNVWVWAYDARMALSARLIADALGGRLVYDLVDNCSIHPEQSEQQNLAYKQGYQDVAAVSEQVFTNNLPMSQHITKLGAKAICIPNGVYWERFHRFLGSDQPEPRDIATIPRPRVGFVGILSSETDHTLLNKVAEEVPGCEVVFIGQWMGSPEALHPRIHQLGMKPYNMIPAYMAGLDLGLSIYKPSPATAAGDSLKVYEYLAAGKPAVATNAQDHQRKSPYVNVAENPMQFVELVRTILQNKISLSDAEARSRNVRIHDWQSRVDRMLDILEKGQRT